MVSFIAPISRVTSIGNFAVAAGHITGSHRSVSLQMALGGHNQKFRFIPTVRLETGRILAADPANRGNLWGDDG